ncbi:MAG: GGDEF domain-containing protein [Oscillospiraceae bacterium]
MARRIKMKDTPEIRRIRISYGIIGLVFVIFMVASTMGHTYVYRKSRDTYAGIITSEKIIKDLTVELDNIDMQMIYIAAGITTDISQADETISASLNEIKRLSSSYESQPNLSEKMQHRFTVAKYALKAYERKINELRATGVTDSSKIVYQQEVQPLQAVAVEMVSALSDIGDSEIATMTYNLAMQNGFSNGIPAIAALLLIIMLFFTGTSQIKALREIHEKESELDEQAERLDRTRQKMFDAAHMNILTGLNNRYALESTLEDLIGEVQFNIAVFDMDNFRAVNDQLGYEVGDEYLSTLAERLKEEYAQNCDIYNISGNEFAMIFGDTLSDMQAQQLAEQVRQMLGSPVMVAGVVLQNSCSGALYHVLPSENMSITSLLMRLDSALHEAKRQGGNRMFYI